MSNANNVFFFNYCNCNNHKLHNQYFIGLKLNILFKVHIIFVRSYIIQEHSELLLLLILSVMHESKIEKVWIKYW